MFKDIFPKIFGGGEGTALGVDIGSSSIKVVEIKKKGGRAMLETYGVISLGPYAGLEIGKVTNLPVEKIVEALKEVMKASKVSSTSASFSIPMQSSLVFTLSLPSSLKQSEISSVVPTEARRYIPVPITEVTLDYFALPKRELSFEEMQMEGNTEEKEAKTEILVVAIQNDAISKYRSISGECGLSSDFFEIEIFSSIRSNFGHELSLVLLMDFGASATKLSLVEFGTVKSYHTVSRGGADITNSIAQSLNLPFNRAEELKKEFGLFDNGVEKGVPDVIRSHLDYIFAETNNTLAGFEKKYNRSVSKVIFTGGGSLLKGLKEVASANFRTDIEIGHPFSKVGAPDFLSKVLETTGPEFGSAIGLALRKLQ